MLRNVTSQKTTEFRYSCTLFNLGARWGWVVNEAVYVNTKTLKFCELLKINMSFDFRRCSRKHLYVFNGLYFLQSEVPSLTIGLVTVHPGILSISHSV
jgi:hypothetical protein